MADYSIEVAVPNTGPQGEVGPVGPANTLSVGTVSTGAAGSNASATVSGTAPNQTLNLTIPRGDTGATGNTGPTGDTGPIGPTGPQGPIGQPGTNALTGFDNTPLAALLWRNPDSDVVRETINTDNTKTFTNFGALPTAFLSTAADLAFYRDFAGEKTLNHAAGPSITFTRASGATYFDANGVLQTASNGVPRFDHSQDGAANSLGLLIEEARTNSIRNSQAGGSTNGVIGVVGIAPTNWTTSAPTGVTREIIGTGTLNGFSYIDIKFSGTNTSGSSGTILVGFDSTTQVVAANGQSWTGSAYIALVGGSFTGSTGGAVQLVERNVSGTFLASTATAITAATSSLARYSVSRTLNQATTERTNVQVVATVANSATIDLTLRIAAPQLEQGAFPTSYIPTTSAAATRSADSAVVTPISGFYNGTEGTIYNEFSPLNLDGTSVVRGVVAFTESSGWINRLLVGYRGTGAQFFTAVANNVNEFNVSGTAGLIVSGTTAKAIQAYQTNNSARALNGAAVVAVSGAITAPTRERMLLGQADAPNFLNGHIRKVAYYPKRLTNALLEQITT